jgi:hypothetical protein
MLPNLYYDFETQFQETFPALLILQILPASTWSNIVLMTPTEMQELSHGLCIRNSSTTFLNVYGVLVQSLKPLNDTANQETPTSPEGSKTAFVDSTAVSSSKSKSSAECETNALLSMY